MKKIIYLLVIISFPVILSACSSKQADNDKAISNPITNPGGYTQDMVNLNKNMQKNIKNSTNKENAKTSQALDDADVAKEQSQTVINSNIPTDLASKYPYAVIHTNLGDIKVKMKEVNTPLAVNNFLNLAQKGFYNGTKFHRVIKGFMIQGGDPNSKNESAKDTWGMGGPGYKFKDELTGTEKYTQGTLAMANSGANTNGSQFFIVTASPSVALQPNYTIFGHVVAGMDTALKIENVPIGENDRPLQDVIIKAIEPLKK
jgi:cyclophilin family peptidyl-prolyl cis-trans isomerase